MKINEGVFTMDADEIKQMIEAGLPGAQAQVKGDDGSHFDALIISDEFDGKSIVQQQKLVYGTLGDHITSGRLHAFSMKTMTTAQWAAAGSPVLG